MSFKLLAIRPLEGTDPSLLKGLKPNCIYRFYNEYDYLYEYDENTGEGKSFIGYQDQYFKEASNKEDDYLKLEKKEIKAIKYNKELPAGFFGENINVSAIVGENGSGKSTLLEIYYYFLYNYSFYHGVLKNNDAVLHLGKNCHIELYYEYYNEIIKVVFKPGKGEVIPIHYIMKYNVFVVDSNDVKLINRDFWKRSYTFKSGKEVVNLPLYNVALNYGLYGLNSSINGYGWLKPLFHKNDGYQTPLVINPMRTNGNIDINTEYRLLTQRLMINHFVIGNKKLLSNINVEDVSYSLEVYRYQFYDYQINEVNEITINDDILPVHQRNLSDEDLKKFSIKNDNPLMIDWFKFFLESNFEGRGEIDALEAFLEEFKKYNKQIDFTLILSYWKNNVKNKQQFIINRDKEVLSVEEIQFLNLLYIYYKLYKMTLSYVEYYRFHYLFNVLNNDEFFLKIEKNKKELLRVVKKNKNVQSDKVYTEIYNSYKVIEESINPRVEVNYNFRLRYIKELVEKVKFNNYEDFTNKVFESILNSINKSRTEDLFRFIKHVMTTNTHVEFKIHQAISYFESNIFESLIDVGKSVFNERSGYYDLHIRNEYFTNANGESRVFDINKVPIAFFNLDILVKKYNEQNSYSFRNLSSGEQQMINALLTIVYHLFYIQSVHKSDRNKIKYFMVNIILDEIELYFHPDYQRRFVLELMMFLQE